MTERGFSLIEVMVAMTVFAIVSSGLFLFVGTGLKVARSNRERSVAANLASQEMDAVRQLPFASVVNGLTTKTAAVDGVNFTIERNAEWVGTNATAGECDSSSTAPKVLRVTVEVTWPNMVGTPGAQTSSVLSPPAGAYDATLGHIGVRVRDSTATPLGSVPVRVVGTGVDRTISTTDAQAASAGCAFFGYLAPGSYTVTLNSSGYVDRQGSATASQTVGVSASTVASVSFDYDRAATLVATLAGVGGATPVSTIPVSLGNTGLIPSGKKSIPGTGLTRTLTNLFPYTDGYEAWGGSCRDADPEGLDTLSAAYWPGAQRPDAFNVDPNVTTTGTITLPKLTVNFTQGANDGTDTVTASHATDSSCPSGETYTLGTVPGQTGSVVTALPYGTWTIKVTGKTITGGNPSVVLDPRSTGTYTVNLTLP